MNRRLGAREGEALTRINLGEVEEILGDWRRARRHAKPRPRPVGRREATVRTGSAAQLLLASLARKSGETGEAASCSRRRAPERRRPETRTWRCRCSSSAACWRSTGDDRAGRPRTSSRRSIAARTTGTEELLGRILARPGRAGARRAATGRRRAARPPRRGSWPRGSATGSPGGACWPSRHGWRRSRARTGERTGRGAGAPFADAVAALEEVEAPYEVARALYAWGLRTGRARSPRSERLERALAIFERSAPTRTPRGPGARPAALASAGATTARERRPARRHPLRGHASAQLEPRPARGDSTGRWTWRSSGSAPSAG